jgi:hypothetical protein
VGRAGAADMMVNESELAMTEFWPPLCATFVTAIT